MTVQEAYRAYRLPLVAALRRRAVVLGLSDRDADTEALVQDTFEQALRAWDTVRAPRAWLYTVARRQLARRVGEAERQAEGDLAVHAELRAVRWSTLAPRPTAQDYAAAREAVALIAQIPQQRRREVAGLRYLEEMGFAEIAERLGCDPATARVHAMHARDYLGKHRIQEYPARSTAGLREGGGSGDRDEAAPGWVLALLLGLALSYARAGDAELAGSLCRVAADAGHIDALTDLARWRERAADAEPAEVLHQLAADIEHTKALADLETLRVQARNREEAARRLQIAIAVRPEVLMDLGREREPDQALLLGLRPIGAGDAQVLTDLALRRDRAGDGEEAERLAFRVADAGHIDALIRLAGRRDRAGDHEAAERLVLRAADAGHTRVLTDLVSLRERVGNHDGAHRLRRLGLEIGGSHGPAPCDEP
jgi:RNA polymerase sigma-70 factor (ECF subfamily)